MKNVSIIITFYQQTNILDTCIKNIIDTVDKTVFNYEILVINDNPQINLNKISQKYKNSCDISIIQLPENCGYAKACNIGIPNAKNEYILLMDSDIIPSENWLSELFRTYSSLKNPGSVSAKILEADTNHLFGFGIGVHNVDFILYKRHGSNDMFSEKDRRFAMISSGCLLLKKDLYIKIDGQDEYFYNADNDLDLTYRIHLLGKENVISTNSIVHHRGHVSGNIRTAPFRQDSKAYFFKKWGNRIQTNTLDMLKELYSSFPVQEISNKVIIVNFSNSLSRKDYIDLICKTLDIEVLQFFDIKNINMSEKIFINDFLSWDICRTNIPIIYFSDDYRNLLDNFSWFSNRIVNDAIFDKNGNYVTLKNKGKIPTHT